MFLTEQLEHASDYVQQNFSPLNKEQLNWKPAASKWSIAQCIDHLIITNSRYFKTFDELLQSGYKPTLWQCISPFSNWWGKQLLKWTDTIPAKKMKTTRTFAPTNKLIDEGIIPLFVQQQRNLISYFEQLNIMTKQKKIIISSPASSFITYNLRTAMRALTQHEQRHINQANNVLHHPLFPKQ